MPDKMRVTSFMGVTTGLRLPPELRISIAIAWPKSLAFFGTPLAIEPSLGQFCGDVGSLLLRS
jgi:hypothetical protein